jgi:hypothetical protein
VVPAHHRRYKRGVWISYLASSSQNKKFYSCDDHQIDHEELLCEMLVGEENFNKKKFNEMKDTAGCITRDPSKQTLMANI